MDAGRTLPAATYAVGERNQISCLAPVSFFQTFDCVRIIQHWAFVVVWDHSVVGQTVSLYLNRRGPLIVTAAAKRP